MNGVAQTGVSCCGESVVRQFDWGGGESAGRLFALADVIGVEAGAVVLGGQEKWCQGQYKAHENWRKLVPGTIWPKATVMERLN